MTECRWCGETHLKGICPKVKAIEFAEDGETVRRVEFMTPRDCMPANGWPLQGAGPAVAVYPYVPPVVVPHTPIRIDPAPYDPSMRPQIWCSTERPMQ